MEFLVKKHFKIKSQKIRGVISQGLLIPLSAFDFGDEVKEGDFLTEKLGVTYAVVADEKRKKTLTLNIKQCLLVIKIQLTADGGDG